MVINFRRQIQQEFNSFHYCKTAVLGRWAAPNAAVKLLSDCNLCFFLHKHLVIFSVAGKLLSANQNRKLAYCHVILTNICLLLHYRKNRMGILGLRSIEKYTQYQPTSFTTEPQVLFIRPSPTQNAHLARVLLAPT